MRPLQYCPGRDSVYLTPEAAEFEVSVIQRLSGDRGDLSEDLKHLKFPKIHDVLDIGTGMGYFVEACVRAGMNAYGVDVRDIYEGDRSRFKHADARKLPFEDESFDLVFESLFFDDLFVLQKPSAYKIESIINEIHRVLRTNGIFYIHGEECPLLDPDRFECLVSAHTKQFYRKTDGTLLRPIPRFHSEEDTMANLDKMLSELELSCGHTN